MNTQPVWWWAAAPDDTSWRNCWELWRPLDVGAYYAQHVSGLAFELFWDSLDAEDIDQGWRIWTDEGSEPLAELMDRDTRGRVDALTAELMILWRELGFKDDIRSGLKRP